jgi:hypothetical protein
VLSPLSYIRENTSLPCLPLIVPSETQRISSPRDAAVTGRSGNQATLFVERSEKLRRQPVGAELGSTAQLLRSALVTATFNPAATSTALKKSHSSRSEVSTDAS